MRTTPSPRSSTVPSLCVWSARSHASSRTNPHTYFYIDVVDAQGKVTNWGVEGASPGALSRRGWKREDLKIGGKVVVEGYRAKNGSNLADGRLVTLPDGRKVYGGSPGDGGPGDDGTDHGSLPGTSK